MYILADARYESDLLIVQYMVYQRKTVKHLYANTSHGFQGCITRVFMRRGGDMDMFREPTPSRPPVAERKDRSAVHSPDAVPPEVAFRCGIQSSTKDLVTVVRQVLETRQPLPTIERVTAHTSTKRRAVEIMFQLWLMVHVVFSSFATPAHAWTSNTLHCYT